MSKNRCDVLILGIILALIAGLVIPLGQSSAHLLSMTADIGVGLVFLVYGMRLPIREVINAVKNIRLQGTVLASTYIFFPILGIIAHWAFRPFIGTAFATGLLYLSLLPSTVQSSVTFVSIAKGNVAAAVCAATISNILGMFFTPLLVLTFLDLQGASTGGFSSVLLKLLAPFIIGQLLQPLVGNWMRAHRRLTKTVDNGAIIVVVFSAVVEASRSGVWNSVTVLSLIVLIAVLAILLAIVLCTTWWSARKLGFLRADQIVVLMCGSKKSLATGLPMAKALFSSSMVGTIAIPVIVFHQMQLIVCAFIARKLAEMD